MSSTQIDLQELALDHVSDRRGQNASSPIKWFSRYVLPISVVVGFLCLILYSASQHLLPAPKVRVVPVIVKKASARVAGTVLFQAAGWIEPRPTSVVIPALAAGVVEQLLIVEGQEVQRGEPIAKLITTDAEISVRRAKAELSRCEGELQHAQANLAVAKSLLATPLHLELPLAEAQALLAKAQTESHKLPFLIKAAEAQMRVAKGNFESKRDAGSAVAESALLEAEGDFAAAKAELEELNSRVPNLQREIDSLKEKVKVLEQQIKLQLEDHGRVAEAEGKVVAAKAQRDQALLRVEQAQLDLERMTVLAPMDGRILSVVATPGTRVMGLEHFAGQSSSTVAEMYDPARLQVRVDVRLENVPQVMPGAPVQIRTASSSTMLAGRVLRPTSVANIQKNTLEVKVELLDPPSAIRPDMLVNAAFVSAAAEPNIKSPFSKQRIFIPKQLASVTESGVAYVWIVDSKSHAKKTRVKLGEAEGTGLIEVVSGLNATDKLITSNTSILTSEGTVVIVGEDTSIGVP
ncbi:MAG: HlyD family efflux transporter periplasmic adaptor subunit [Planctomycetota bacterium]|nr:HlyD family efflux transporter periplasmic adaptor subunit [Planctomycetota bacterium]